MKRMTFVFSAGLLSWTVLSAGIRTALAEEITVLCANPVHEGLVHIAEQFQRDTGHEVKIQVANTAELNRRLAAGDPADVLVGTTAMVDQTINDGKVTGTKSPVARVGIGVVVRRGAPLPSVGTAAAIRQAVLDADAVVYNTAGSGQYVQRMFDQMGVSEQIRDKSARPANAAQTMERLVQGRGNEIGFGLISEIKPHEDSGVQFVAPLPGDLQNYTHYDAVVLTGSASAELASVFIRYLSTPAAKRLWAESGVD